MRAEFVGSEVAKSMRDREALVELDASSAAIYLAQKMGVFEKILPPNPKDLLNYLIWGIKSRFDEV